MIKSASDSGKKKRAGANKKIVCSLAKVASDIDLPLWNGHQGSMQVKATPSSGDVGNSQRLL